MIEFITLAKRPALTALAVAGAVFAQSTPFNGFTQGNLVVSRSDIGDASTVSVGHALPRVCPATAACGKVMTTDSSAYPSTTSSNSVWNQDKVDGSFGVTSPTTVPVQTTAAGVAADPVQALIQ